MVFSLPSTLFKDREKFLSALDSAMKSAGIKLSAPMRKAVLSALSERDETAEICRDHEGNPEPDPNLRDTENVPLSSEGVETFFDREVKPHVPDAWINRAIRDPKDGQFGSNRRWKRARPSSSRRCRSSRSSWVRWRSWARSGLRSSSMKLIRLSRERAPRP